MPRRAIIVYSGNGNGSGIYLEQRDIKTISGKQVLGAATPMPEDVFKEIARSYVKNTSVNMSFGRIIPEHILHASNSIGHTCVIWYRPAMLKGLNFAAGLGIKGESAAHIPATLYVVLNSSLYLFALESDTRPDLKTKLYRAPFFNIYTDGRVCLGTAHTGKQKSPTFEGEADRFERAFYLAEQNGGDTAGCCKTKLPELWTSLIKSKAKFPSKQELVQHPSIKTFSDLINKFAK
ncbi:MAG: hypothetical protein WC756_03645 [Taibaiella sp.]